MYATTVPVVDCVIDVCVIEVSFFWCCSCPKKNLLFEQCE